jgi:hypothetical protein
MGDAKVYREKAALFTNVASGVSNEQVTGNIAPLGA